MKTRTCSSIMCCSAVALVALAAGNAARAQCSFQKLIASDAANSDWFGYSAAGGTIGGNPTVVFGARFDDTAAGANAGSIYVFQNSGLLWNQISHVLADDGAANDYFGTSVDMADPYVIVGAPGAGVGGAAYIYERSGGSAWVKKTKILRPGVAAGDNVGQAVAVTSTNGGWALVGCPYVDVNFNPNPGSPTDPDAGVVLLCQRQANGTWAVADTWPPHYNVNSGYYGNELVGSAVSIAGDVAVYGAPYGHNINWPLNHGYIVTYHRQANNTWAYDTRLVSNNAEADDHYGAAVSTDGTYIAIGAPDDDSTAAQTPKTGAKTNSGCVYLQRYSAGTWYIDGQIFASDASDNARFGASVAVKNGMVVVGAPGARKTYLFKRLGVYNWVQVAAYNDPDTAASGTYGASVAIAGDRFVVGDSTDNDGALTDQGAAYAYYLPGAGMPSDSCAAATVVQSGIYTGCTNAATVDGATNCGNTLNGDGPDVWYSWTPNCSGNIIIDTYGSAFDTILSVHTACPENGNSHSMICNDDASPPFAPASLVTFNYTAGTTYLIRIAGWNGAMGNFTLRINEYQHPANDACASARIAGNGATPFVNCQATIDGPLDDTACVNDENIGADVWFRYTATSTGPCVISTCGANFDTILMVYGQACPTFNSQSIACSDDSTQCGGFTLQSYVTPNLIGGHVYTIRVGGYTPPLNTNTSVGQGNLNIAPSCPCNVNGGALGVQDIFDYLTFWFSASPAADFNGSGTVSVQDIFDFLQCWFAGCA